MKTIKKIVWVLFAFLAIAVGLYPLVYLVLESTFGLLSSKSAELLQDSVWNIAFYSHIFFGGMALLIGWSQFSSKLRKNRLQLHRNIGKAYVILVMASGLSSLYIGWYATGGVVAKLGFITLGLIWLYTTSKAYLVIRKGDISNHEKMMIYSYAACFGAVTLRIWLPILINLHHGDFVPAYRIVAWLSWVPNIVVAFFLVKRRGLA